MITIIAAKSKNDVVGVDGKLPWHLPEDLKRFKSLTHGNIIVMGRKTYESIGKPLPGRTNIILTKKKDYLAEGCLVYNNPQDILSIFEKNNIFIIGGADIWKLFWNIADKIELTLIDKDFDGDVFFPKIETDWIESQSTSYSHSMFDYKFITYHRNEYL
jgi:dihydrofolate reductase